MLKNKAVAIFACMIAGFSFITLNTPTSLAIFVISLFFPVFSLSTLFLWRGA